MPLNIAATLRNRVSPVSAFAASLAKAVRNPLFYCLTFRPGSLRMDTTIRCGIPAQPYAEYRFVRSTLFYFELQYNGTYTHCGYFIDENEVD